jgi:hypothetical protein
VLKKLEPEHGGLNSHEGKTKELQEAYYDITKPCGFSSVDKLAKHVNLSRKDTKEWLSAQEPYTLHKPIKRKFTRSRYVVPSIRNLFEADLADMQSISKENDGVNYLCCVIDVFSKVVHVEPMKDKTGKSTAAALKLIFKRMGKPLKFRSDLGKEFVSNNVKKLLKDLKIKQYFTNNNETKCACIERWLRTLKERLYRYFTHFGKQRYVDILQEVVQTYNNTRHSAIGCKPSDVNYDNTKYVYNYLYSGDGRYKKLEVTNKKRPSFKKGDFVKISESKRHFDKGFRPNFSHEYFVITSVLKRNPVVYKIKDSAGENVTGLWYDEELQKVNIDDSTAFRIEQILETKGQGARKKLLVKWQGYPAKFNSWINEKDLIHL